MSNNNKTIHQLRKINEAKICDVPSCNIGRDGISRYCRSHWWNSTSWGHPEGKGLKKKDYRKEFEQVSEVIDRNRHHKGIQYCLEQIKGFLSEAASTTKYHYQVARLEADPKVTPILILKTASAIYHLRELHPYLFKSDKHFNYVAGNALVLLVPKGKRLSYSGKSYWESASPKAKRELGEFVQKALSPQLYMISKFILSESERQAEARKQMNQPLV